MGAEHSETLVSVVIVTYNSADVLPACLDSLHGQGASAVIVVDNCSTDATVSEASSREGVQLVLLERNAGFAAANNRGLALVRTPYVLFLNPDTSYSSNATVSHLTQFLQEHPRAAVVGPRLLRPNGEVQRYAFGADPSLPYLLRRGLARLLVHRPLHDWSTTTQRVDWVAGTCLLARSDAMRAVGGWDEGFFMYFEDADLCRRLRAHGWEVWYDPRVHTTHSGGQADYGDVRRRQVYYRSLLHYYRKHFGLLAWAVLGTVLRPYLWLTGMGRREVHENLS